MRWAGRVDVDRPVQLAMGGLWAGYTLAYLAFFYVFQDAREIADASLDGYLEVLLLGVPSVVMLAGVVWLHESDVQRDLRSGVVEWTVCLALVFAVAMHAATFVIEARFDPGEQWLLLLFSTGFGGAAGTVTGVAQVRSNQHERERRRSQIRAETVERERNQLETLNQYLRHEVLNEMQKIHGYAWRLEETVDADDADQLASLRNSSEAVVEFVQSIRKILDASGGGPERAPVDLRAMLTGEMAHLERTHDAATVTVECPDGVTVLAGGLLERVFVNLVENALEHNDGTVTVTLAVEAGPERVTVRVRDDGSGIPRASREGLFAPPESGDHGFGLFLTRELVELYGGRIELESTGHDGTVFAVHLPSADASERTTAAASATAAAEL
jgi:signal transduction histidine kinase